MNQNYMAIPIEDTIISYFDGRLTDSEGAELLHRVSVSPEIRQIFQEHEALRQITARAARNVVISPELEESLFQRVAAMREEESLPVGFWSMRRVSAAAGVAAILIAGVFGISEFRNNHHRIVSDNSSSTIVANNAPISNNTNSLAASTIVANTGNSNTLVVHHDIIEKRNSHNSADAFARTGIATNSEESAGNAADELVSKPAESNGYAAGEHDIELLPALRSGEVAHITMPTTEHTTIESLRDLPMMSQASDFELGVETPLSSGFSFPGNMPHANILSDFSLRFAYNLDTRNQFAMKVTRGGFAGLSVISANEGSFVDVNGKPNMLQGYAEELFYQHREAMDHGLFFVTGAIGGGFYGQGSRLIGQGLLLTAQIGLEVPIGERFLGGVSLVVSRLHQYGLAQSLLTSNEPVIYDGSTQYNTLAGSIEYGLSYRF